MKFELVEPADWRTGEEPDVPDAERIGDPADDQAEDIQEGGEESEPAPLERLRASTEQLRTHVTARAAQLGPALARLRAHVASADHGLAGSGHRGEGRLPSSFRVDRFGASNP
ncbi:hypothetical protein NI17_020510 [Thermobifida halotolerans]|uniref:Uncharacterized protein n=1 Tax=Thermobifida halotolerans TaxID=483545 RepID=A0A399G318_9ACTN|nr:hypothetical protein [Thermobifida halotolerans]UOE19111.1 hypothetical protein NI17_020510 [Thermobifida halotolerans]